MNNNIDYFDKKQMFKEALKEIDNDNIITILIFKYNNQFIKKIKDIKLSFL